MSDNKNKSTKTRSIISTVVTLVAACIIIAAAFFCGYWYRGTKNSAYDWVLNAINNYYYKDVDTSNYTSDSINAYISQYLDQYSAYYTAEEYAALKAEEEGNLSGFGYNYSYYENGNVQGALLIRVVPNSPFYNAGLRSGDIIVSASLNGEVTQFTSGSVFSSYMSSLETGESVTFVTSEGKEAVAAKQNYTASYVWFATNEHSWAYVTDGEGKLTLTQSTTDVIDELPDGCAYICLTQFQGDSVTQFGTAIETINGLGCTDIILDLRCNGGGDVAKMCSIAGYFVSGKYDDAQVAMTAEYKNGSVYTAYTTVYSGDCVVKDGTNIYVLANGNTASASEALIGVLISYGIIDYSNIYISDYTSGYYSATGYSSTSVKSARTYGKGIMQTTYVRNSTGEAIKLTVAQTYWPNGKTIHGVGITEEDGATLISSPYMANGYGAELLTALSVIFP